MNTTAGAEKEAATHSQGQEERQGRGKICLVTVSCQIRLTVPQNSMLWHSSNINPRLQHLNGMRMVICMLPHSDCGSMVQRISELIYVKCNTKEVKGKVQKGCYFEHLGFSIHFVLLPAVSACCKGREDGDRDAFNQGCYPKSTAVKVNSYSICPCS